MGCSKPRESLPASKLKKAIDEIIKGLQLANQLRSLLNDSLGEDGSALANDLILKIMSSFTNSLTILSSSESSRESCRNDISTLKDRKGRYKRRKNSQVWIEDTPCLIIDDGHPWTKYGQKVILNAEHPRTFLNYDSRSISDPVFEDSGPFVLMSFGDTKTAGEQNHLFTLYFPSAKQEHKKEKTSSNPVNLKQSSSWPDYDLLSPSHMMTFDSFNYETIFSEFDIGDVVPGVINMGLDFDDDIKLFDS